MARMQTPLSVRGTATLQLSHAPAQVLQMQHASPGGPQVWWQLCVVINDSIAEVSGEPVIIRLQELVVAGMAHCVGRPQAVQVQLACHIAHHKAVAAGGPVAVHQLDVVCPAAMYVRPRVLGREAAQSMLSGA